MQRSKLGALSKNHNWSAGPWPDQSFYQRNKLNPRDFAGETYPSCILFRILLVWLDTFDLKWNSHFDGNGLAPQSWQMESALYKKGVLFCYERYTKEVLSVLSNMVHKRIRGWTSGRSISTTSVNVCLYCHFLCRIIRETNGFSKGQLQFRRI